MPNTGDSSSTTSRILQGAVGGAIFGALLLGVGVVRFVIWLAAGHSVEEPATEEIVQLIVLGLFYCAGFSAAGAALGWLWPLRHRRLGSYGLGYLGAAIVSAACAAIVMLMEKDLDLVKYAVVAAIMTLVFGTVAGYQIRRWW